MIIAAVVVAAFVMVPAASWEILCSIFGRVLHDGIRIRDVALAVLTMQLSQGSPYIVLQLNTLNTCFPFEI